MKRNAPHADDFADRYEAAARQVFDRIDQACAETPDWPRGVRAAVASVLSLLVDEPRLGRTLLLDAYQAGPQARVRHEANLERLANLLRAGREHVDAPPMPDIVEEGLVGSLGFIVVRPIRAGEVDLLPALGPDLTELLLAPYVGHEEAERVAGLDG